jgi:hypothetical protein
MKVALALSCLLGIHTFAESDHFDQNLAVQDAGRMVDSGAVEFFAYFVPARTNEGKTVAALSRHLSEAAHARAALAVIGPDSSVTARLLGSALKAAAPGSLQGAILIFVGEVEHAEALKEKARVAGVDFRSTTYSGT